MKTVVLFAGGGGACLGIEEALGRDVDVAINHDAEAIAMHRRNHPRTKHYQTDVWEVDPMEVLAGQKLGLLWLSPDCTDFSRAKGGQPIRNKRVRSLAWVGVKWAKLRRPDVIMLENVPEFEEWGPLIPLVKGGAIQHDPRTGKPLMVRDPARVGETFKRFVGQLRRLGYVVKYQRLTACDFGAPTKRKRFFLVARCDGQAIVWPEPTHGKVEDETIDGWQNGAEDTSRNRGRGDSACGAGHDVPRRNAGRGAGRGLFVHREGAASSETNNSKPSSNDNASCQKRRPGSLLPYRTASECIEWSLPCPSIFLTKAEAKAQQLRVQRPLRYNTRRRIAMGLKRFLLDCAKPFIVRCDHGGADFRGQPISSPLSTVTGHHGFGLVAPSLIECANSTWSRGYQAADEPLPTITAAPKGGSWAFCAAQIVRCAHGDGRWGHGAHAVDAPLGTLTGSKDFALSSATLIHYHSEKGNESRSSSPATTLPTLDTSNRYGIVSSTLSPFVSSSAYTGTTGRCKYVYPMNEPLRTITGCNDKTLVAPHLLHLRGTGTTEPLTTPAPTITSGGNHLALAVPCIVEYYGNGMAHPVNAPLHTITSRDRFSVAMPSLVQCSADIGHAKDVYAFLVEFKDLVGVPTHATLHPLPEGAGYVTVTIAGEEYLIVDIGLRMLNKWELAAAQFGPERAKDLVLPESGAEAVDKIGNSVCPDVAAALVRANIDPRRKIRRSA